MAGRTLAHWMGLHRAEAWMQFNNRAAPLTLRQTRSGRASRTCSSSSRRKKWSRMAATSAPTCLIVDEGHPLRGSDANAGFFIVQDEASQLVTLLAGDVRL